MGSLTRAEAAWRAALLRVDDYVLDLDLHRGPHVFWSSSTIRFGCREPGAETFVDVRPIELSRAELNGVALDPATLVDGRLPLPHLDAENVLVVESEMAYRNDGQGLHRSRDSADGRHYVYGHSFLDAAPYIFACFDQPDLKASYAVSITAEPEWTVLGNGPATQVAPGRWRLGATLPLATYFVTVCAGPFASVRTEHDGIPLGLHARASLADALDRHAPQMLEVTRQSFDYYHAQFGIRYPFGEYHQVFVPEFNAGAMENPGCVTVRDSMLFRGSATRDEVLTRSNTIAHELAHMWFGNLVTMRWWDDLWLNESFAEYMSHRTLEVATEFTEAWTDFLVARKVWGYAAERTPSTHPVAGSPAADTTTALHNFDGIAYAKGAAALRQLIAYIGEDVFLTGVRDHLAANMLGNADLDDFLRAMERAGGGDLQAWSAAWLRTARLDVLSVTANGGGAAFRDVVLRRDCPADASADRPHALDVAGFQGGAEQFRVRLKVVGDQTPLTDLVCPRRPALVVPNASDLTWATVRLDETTVRALPGELGLVEDERARAVVWVALVDGVALGWVDPRHLLEVFCSAWPEEPSPSVSQRIANGVTTRLVPSFLRPDEQPAALARVVDAAWRLLDAAPPGSTAALIAARLIGRWTDDIDLLGRWSAARGLPAGLMDADPDFRWELVRNRADRGLASERDIDEELQRDPSMSGMLHALAARSARPDPAAKAWAWQELVQPNQRSNHELVALAQGFWDPLRPELVQPYVERFFTDVPALAGRVGEDALSRIVTVGYPSNQVSQRTLTLTEEALGRSDLSPAARRGIVDQGSVLREALRSLELYAPPAGVGAPGR